MNIDFWVYTDAKEGEDTHVDESNHMIYIKREYTRDEDALYHTYSKTIFAIRELKKLNINYDYLIRTNNSTWINLPLMNEFLAYQEDDSQIFTGRMYGSFWSAFNTYAGGELMVFSKRNIDILDKLSGDNPIKFEQQVLGCDDNLIFGLWNKRLMRLKLRQSNYIHSFEDSLLIDKDIPSEYDFSQIAIQVRTYGVHDRLEYDIKKMRDIQAKWKLNKESLDILYNKMMNRYYDKFIHPIKYSKQEWFKLNEETKTYCKFENTMSREDGLEYLRNRQRECGYTPTLI